MLDIPVADAASRAIVVDSDPATGDTAITPQAYCYDQEDTFVVGETGATFEMWEEALAAIADGSDVTAAQVMWESYEFDRPRDRAVWELALHLLLS